MARARVKIPEIFQGLSKEKIKQLIEKNIYNEFEKNIAIKYYVYENCQIDIAIEYNVDVKTIRRNLNYIISKIEK